MSSDILDRVSVCITGRKNTIFIVIEIKHETIIRQI